LLNHNPDLKMPELNLHHIDQVTRDVRTQEIGFSHLFNDLVDHICCDIEYEMQQGLSFEDAYRMVKAKIGFRGLRKIQEDTLYAVDTKYRNMKNLMKISGVAGTVMLGFAAIFKISHWPMAGALVTLGALVISFLFLPSALIVLWKETKNQKKLILFISAFISGLAFIFGMCFKIQHWPGASVMVFIGLGTATLLFIPSLLIHLFQDKGKKHKRPLYVAGAVSIIFYMVGFWFKIIHWPLATVLMLTGSFMLMIVVFPWFTRVQWKNETNVNARFIFMTIVPLLFILPGALINLNVSRKYDEGFVKRAEKQDVLINIQKESNSRFLSLYRDSLVYSRMDSIHLSSVELLGIINKIEHTMVTIAEEYKGETDQALITLSGSDTDAAIPYGTLKAPFHEIPASLMLLPGCKAREILEKEILKYKETIGHATHSTNKYDQFLTLSDYLPETGVPAYELGLMPRLISLSLLKNAVLLTESEALKLTSKKANN
jgi:hypothetical protein